MGFKQQWVCDNAYRFYGGSQIPGVRELGKSSEVEVVFRIHRCFKYVQPKRLLAGKLTFATKKRHQGSHNGCYGGGNGIPTGYVLTYNWCMMRDGFGEIAAFGGGGLR